MRKVLKHGKNTHVLLQLQHTNTTIMIAITSIAFTARFNEQYRYEPYTINRPVWIVFFFISNKLLGRI